MSYACSLQNLTDHIANKIRSLFDLIGANIHGSNTPPALLVTMLARLLGGGFHATVYRLTDAIATCGDL